MPGGSNEEFLKELFDNYRQMMFKIAFGILHNNADAEDVVQSAFLWIINNLEIVSQKPCNERGAYFASIIEHRCIDILRKRKNHPNEDIEEQYDLSSDECVEDKALSSVTVDEIKSAMDELSDRDYELFYMYLFKEMSPKEVGEAMGISENNARVNIHRARKRFIKILRKRGIDYDF